MLSNTIADPISSPMLRPNGIAANLSTLLSFNTAVGTWGAHYWIGNERLVNDGDYVEFVISELNFNCVFGVGASGSAPSNLSDYGFVLWPFNHATDQFAAVAAGTVSAWLPITWQLFDRFRIRKSGTDLIVSQNGTDIHTEVGYASSPLYIKAGSQDDGSVYVDSFNGGAVTTKLSAAVTAELGTPSKDYFADDANIYYSKYNWIPDGAIAECKEANQPDAFFKFKFRGQNCAILIDATQHGISSGGTWIGYRVDGGAWSYYYPIDAGRSQVQIASGLSQGVHSCEVAIRESHYDTRYNATIRYGSIFFWGVRLSNSADDAILAPVVHSDTMIVYGDSNSEGGEAGGVLENAQLSFARELARLIGVEHSTISCAGQGWITTPGGGWPTFQNSWNKNSDTSTRSFTDEPKYIFIVHGQNDPVDGDLPVETVIDAMLGVTTNTKIMVCVPCGTHRRAYLTAQVAAINDPRVFLVDNPTNLLLTYGSESGSHLIAAGHLVYAAQLYSSAQPNL